jgi:hypothetical protein
MGRLKLFSSLVVLTIATILVGFSAGSQSSLVPVCQTCTAGSALWTINPNGECYTGGPVRSVNDTGITCTAFAPCTLSGTISVGAICTQDLCVQFFSAAAPGCGGSASVDQDTSPFNWNVGSAGSNATDINCNAGAPWCTRYLGVAFYPQANPGPVCAGSPNEIWSRLWTCSR